MKKWYVVQTVANGEDYFRRDLLVLSQEAGLSDRFGEVLVPIRKKGVEDLVGEKIFPGYVLVCVDMNGEIANFISRVPRFSKFVGGVPPVPLQDSEVEKVFESASKVLRSVEAAFVVGDSVKIVKGPFSTFIGKVEGFEADGQKVKVLISIFGRATSIVVDLDQVEV